MREKFVVFETKFKVLLLEVNDDNYSSIIDGFVVLINEYKSILSKSQVLTILYKINHELEMNQFQENLFIEIEGKVMGDVSFE